LTKQVSIPKKLANPLEKLMELITPKGYKFATFVQVNAVSNILNNQNQLRIKHCRNEEQNREFNQIIKELGEFIKNV
jgi:hypothetical protein